MTHRIVLIVGRCSECFPESASMNVNVYYVGQDGYSVADAIKNMETFEANTVLTTNLLDPGPIPPPSDEVLYVFCSDKTLVDEMLSPFARIPASRKIFFQLDKPGDDQDPQRLSQKLALLVQHRLWLIAERADIPQKTDSKNPHDFNQWSYQDLATELAYHCKQHLIKIMGREDLNEQQKWVRPLVGLFQAPVQSEPRSGTTDVAVCYSIAADACCFPGTASTPIHTDYPPQETNANWESLFTLFYAMLVCYGSNSELQVSPQTSISPQGPNVAHPTQTFRNVFDALVKRSQESSFWRGEKEKNGRLKITLVSKT